MKKVFLKLIIPCFLFLSLIINVKAYSLHCEYQIGDNENIKITIDYDKDKEEYKTPNVVLKLPHPSLSSYYHVFSYIPVEALQKSETDSTLACPNLFLEQKQQKAYIHNYVYYRKADCTQTGSCSEIKILTDKSKVDNTGKPNNGGTTDNPSNPGDSTQDPNTSTTDSGLPCYCESQTKSSKNIKFTIKKDNNGNFTYIDVKQNNIITSTNNYRFIYNITDYKCPDYLDIKFLHNTGVFQDYSVTPGTSSSEYKCNKYDYTYRNDNDFQLNYYLLPSGTTTCRITKDSNNNYVANIKDQKIEITNMSTFNPNSPPSYIIKDGVTGKYSFSEKADSSGNNKIYTLASKISEFGNLSIGEIEKTCEAIFGEDFIYFVKKNVLNVIYIVVPILLLVLTTIDFVKVVMSNEKDGVKKAGTRFGKRVIAAILIYLTPTILIFLAEIMGASPISDCAKYIQKISKEENSSE